MPKRQREQEAPPSLDAALGASFSPAAHAAWRAAAGVRLHASLALELAPAPSREGFRVVARAAAPRGALLLEVPLAACLLPPRGAGAAPAGSAQAAVAAAPACRGLPPLYAAAAALASLLLRAAAAAAAARPPPPPLGAHAALLAALDARTLRNALCLGAREAALLRGTALADAAGSLPARARFREALLPVARAHPDLWPVRAPAAAAAAAAAAAQGRGKEEEVSATVRVRGPEPGYVATPAFVLAAAFEVLEGRHAAAGVLTPGAACRGANCTLIARLRALGVTFEVV